MATKKMKCQSHSGDCISHNFEPCYVRLHWISHPWDSLLWFVNDLVFSFVYSVVAIRFIASRIMSTCGKLTGWTWQSENHWGLQRMASSGLEKVGYDDLVDWTMFFKKCISQFQEHPSTPPPSPPPPPPPRPTPKHSVCKESRVQ